MECLSYYTNLIFYSHSEQEKKINKLTKKQINNRIREVFSLQIKPKGPSVKSSIQDTSI